MTLTARLRAIDLTALERAMNTQREHLFEVSAILSCLGNVLDDIYAPGAKAPDLQKVTDTAIRMLDRVATKLDPTMLRRDYMATEYAVARAVADGLREAAAQCQPEQDALRTRLTEAARLIDQLIGREAQQ